MKEICGKVLLGYLGIVGDSHGSYWLRDLRVELCSQPAASYSLQPRPMVRSEPRQCWEPLGAGTIHLSLASVISQCARTTGNITTGKQAMTFWRISES